MGRQALLLVIGYSLIFLMTGAMMSNSTVAAFDNAMNYYEGNIVREIAISAANMGANYIYVNKPLMNANPWWPGWTTAVSFIYVIIILATICSHIFRENIQQSVR